VAGAAPAAAGKPSLCRPPPLLRRHLAAARASPEDQQQQAPESAPAAAAAPVPPSGGSGGALAGGAVAAGVALFLAARFLSGGAGASLAALESASLPLDSALRNGKPTLVEFYAPWCDACRELAPVERDLQQRYGGSVNFVLLDVDNPLWQQEVEEYRVGGIPHFVFLDQKGDALAAAVGRVPDRVLEANVAAMAEGASGGIELPFLNQRAAASALRSAQGVGVDAAAPRAHA